MYYVADTHAFIWYLTGSPSLSKKALHLFTLADEGKITIVISSIVLLEIIDILDKKKVKYEFESLISKIYQSSNFIFSELNWSLLLEVYKLKGFTDLHDRVIVATAKIYDAVLISKDRYILHQYFKTIW